MKTRTYEQEILEQLYDALRKVTSPILGAPANKQAEALVKLQAQQTIDCFVQSGILPSSNYNITTRKNPADPTEILIDVKFPIHYANLEFTVDPMAIKDPFWSVLEDRIDEGIT